MNQQTPDTLSGHILEDEVSLDADELCRACQIRVEHIVAWVDAGILEPSGGTLEDWRFEGTALARARKALSLERDLGINPAGVALALQLLEEIETLRARLRVLGF